MTPSQLLKEESSWTRGCVARNRNGTPVSPIGRDAVSWCLIGALEKCDGSCEAFESLRAVIGKYFPARSKVSNSDCPSISLFNDSHLTTHAEVRALLRETGL